MAKVLQNIFDHGVDEVAQTFIIESWHVSQSVDAFTAATDYDISVSGSITLVGQMSSGDASNIATGAFSHVEGSKSISSGSYSHAEGEATTAVGLASHAEGLFTIASGSYQHVSGKYNKQGDDTSLFIIGNGTSDGARSDAFKVRMSGSIVLPTTASAAPTWTGVDGEIVAATLSGKYYLYMWMDGAWRSSSFA